MIRRAREGAHRERLASTALGALSAGHPYAPPPSHTWYMNGWMQTQPAPSPVLTGSSGPGPHLQESPLKGKCLFGLNFPQFGMTLGQLACGLAPDGQSVAGLRMLTRWAVRQQASHVCHNIWVSEDKQRFKSLISFCNLLYLALTYEEEESCVYVSLSKVFCIYTQLFPPAMII